MTCIIWGTTHFWKARHNMEPSSVSTPKWVHFLASALTHDKQKYHPQCTRSDVWLGDSSASAQPPKDYKGMPAWTCCPWPLGQNDFSWTSRQKRGRFSLIKFIGWCLGYLKKMVVIGSHQTEDKETLWNQQPLVVNQDWCGREKASCFLALCTYPGFEAWILRPHTISTHFQRTMRQWRYLSCTEQPYMLYDQIVGTRRNSLSNKCSVHPQSSAPALTPTMRVCFTQWFS